MSDIIIGGLIVVAIAMLFISFASWGLARLGLPAPWHLDNAHV